MSAPTTEPSRDWWPVARLRLTTPRLELRIPPSYDDLLVLGDLAAEGIHDPATMPFGVPWTDAAPGAVARSVLQWHWRALGQLGRDDWSLPFVVLRDDEVIGTQEVRGVEFAVRREVHTGSWLGRPHQRQGFGTEMRAAGLYLAFAGLDARWATTTAFADNVASNGVSRRLGYEPDGVQVVERRGEAATLNRYRLSRDRWAEHATTQVEIHGLDDAVRAMLGA